ncbi:MAG: double-strand break repair protein AddB [Novosphingobium sp.]|nr:double-strand break repair protein AddB [Novosphingobium sp.]MCP5389717.1 double-strand break repair protein AddB [Novosphingobium sp.]
MTERNRPGVYSIAAHRGFADALVAGLLPRYRHPDLGLARLTLLLPSRRAARTVSEAFIRLAGEGLLLPRMAVVGDLDLDETLGPLLDPMGAGAEIAPAADPTRRWLRLAEHIREELGGDAPHGAALLRLAREQADTMDRLLVEDIGPEELLSERVVDLLGDLSGHWQEGLRLFARVQARWLAELQERGELDASARRNRLFDHAARRWKLAPPQMPLVAAGVTSAAPALARLLRVIADMPGGAVILPDLDLAMEDSVWAELGCAGAPAQAGGAPFTRGDAVTHPQYHLKLLLNRMGIARGEVQPWHRAGLAAAPPERSRAISNLFLPPQASAGWVDMPSAQRRLSNVRLMESANPEEEAQAIAILVREALEQPERRVAVITPDRGLAGRIVAHLRRWHIEADDTAGQALPQTPAGRLFLLLAEVMSEHAAPVSLMSLLEHPFAGGGEGRAEWLEHARALELRLRGPRPEPGLDALDPLIAEMARLRPAIAGWWAGLRELLDPLMAQGSEAELGLSQLLDTLVSAAQGLCGDALWAREDGRALATLVEDIRSQAEAVGTRLDPRELPAVLRDAMERVAVRPAWGAHPRVAIYGLLESRMTRADLVICAALNEGSWPGAPAPDPLLAPAVLRALGVPGADFRIGLAAHDLAGAMGAPEVVLSRAQRDAQGPAIPSRFLLRVRALLGADLLARHLDQHAVVYARVLDHAQPAPVYSQPEPCPSAEQRRVDISVTALDRLRSDPYQFYAQAILRLRALDPLDAEPSAAWKGTAVHEILHRWHTQGGMLRGIALQTLQEMNAHPLMRSLWQPRLLKGLEWVEQQIASQEGRRPIVSEVSGEMRIRGIRIHGRVDRIDALADGELAIVDYKTGSPPSGREVEAGYALQLGTLGLMARADAFAGVKGEPTRFEYWSLGKSRVSETGFGYVSEPVREGQKKSGIPRDEFLSVAQHFLDDALDSWILGTEPFTARLNPDVAGYADYDQLMRLDEWMGRQGASDQAAGPA